MRWLGKQPIIIKKICYFQCCYSFENEQGKLESYF